MTPTTPTADTAAPVLSEERVLTAIRTGCVLNEQSLRVIIASSKFRDYEKAMADELLRLRSEVAGLRKDAGRYRWLAGDLHTKHEFCNQWGRINRLPHLTQYPAQIFDEVKVEHCYDYAAHRWVREKLDRVIDAAIDAHLSPSPTGREAG